MRKWELATLPRLYKSPFLLNFQKEDHIPGNSSKYTRSYKISQKFLHGDANY